MDHFTHNLSKVIEYTNEVVNAWEREDKEGKLRKLEGYPFSDDPTKLRDLLINWYNTQTGHENEIRGDISYDKIVPNKEHREL